LERLQREQQSWKPVSKEDRGPLTIGRVVMMQRTPQQLFITSRTGKCVASSIIVDFKVFHGTTSGEAIYNDQANVLAGYTTKCNLVIGITDTTGSMGVLGKHLRDNGMEHAYCTDHNLHCNAVLAFNGEHQSSCM